MAKAYNRCPAAGSSGAGGIGYTGATGLTGEDKASFAMQSEADVAEAPFVDFSMLATVFMPLQILGPLATSQRSQGRLCVRSSFKPQQDLMEQPYGC